VLVLEQLLHHVERLSPGRPQGKSRPMALFAKQRLALGLRQRIGIALGRNAAAVISSALRFQSRKVCASLLEKRATLASVSQVAAEDSAEPSRCGWPSS
jgi:hypothetical protein